MQEFKENMKNILEDIYKDLENVENKEKISENINNIISLFYMEFDKLAEEYNSKLEYLIANQKSMVERLLKIEQSVEEIEQDIYEENEEELEIICPYCNNQFMIDFNNTSNQEIKCPECNNIIELFFDDEEDGCCSGGHCSHDCEDCGHNEDEE